jgi:Trypsin-like peptidase domain
MPKDQGQSIAILKSIWNQDSAGVWSVHDVQTIDLKPRKGYGADYFKIENEVNLLTQRPGAIIQNLFASFGTTEFLVRQSIVPVVAWNDGDAEMRCIGTGFFISASGLLMTAAHVMRDPVDEGYTSVMPAGEGAFRVHDSLHFGVMLPTNPAMRNAPFAIPDQLRIAKYIVCPFEWMTHWGKNVESPLFDRKPDFRLDLDVAVCKVRHNTIGGSYQPLNIGRHGLKIGDRAVAIGYAEMKNIPFEADQEVEPELVVSVGKVTNIYPNNLVDKQTTTPGPCFDIDARIPGKMSGSPILVGSGILTKGVISRSWQGENFASGCLVAPIMGLKLPAGKSILELIATGNEGIADFRASGI